MSNRVNHFKTVPALVKSLQAVSIAVEKISIDPRLKYLIDLRASQLNKCAFCVDMHSKQAKIKGERELRLYHIPIWRESPLFSAKEKAALALTEALTNIDQNGVDDKLYGHISEYFTQEEISEITVAIGLVNMWNRLQILSQMEPGLLDETYGLEKVCLN
ncbi:carboxymuconolactone decarboxylase family protein (plasmid) [Photobacterium sp. GJ3]|uniref:carboxymuconolactone decarboxylase family protein n=1 Tax=Photobacterium sp. GJ3 TaxID=2829502 RepID=UPI001B8C0127|nr:carboxymuconolactone decarboxylase family protein [Photobacterium sp. GJ3]QUJ69823.1 carboxymuconolactone decarboxylase family protein [Photobacterium sp. GJ3]